MATVAALLHAKGRQVWSIKPDATVYDAIELMAEKGIGALIVVKADALVGIVSERDYARKVILRGKSSKDTPVSEIMTTKVLYVRPEQTIDECMALMTAHRIRHLPVLDGATIAGVLSIGDLVKAVIADREVRIQQLENYITGR